MQRRHGTTLRTQSPASAGHMVRSMEALGGTSGRESLHEQSVSKEHMTSMTSIVTAYKINNPCMGLHLGIRMDSLHKDTGRA